MKPYRRAFAGFEVEAVARFRPGRIERLLADPAIVRNRLKIESAIANARAVVALRKEGVSLSELLWSFVGGEPRTNRWRALRDLPARTRESEAMSKDLLRRGFRFVGPTVAYSLMQGAGVVDDHLEGCWVDVLAEN